jgi:hypothetical protein
VWCYQLPPTQPPDEAPVAVGVQVRVIDPSSARTMLNVLPSVAVAVTV